MTTFSSYYQSPHGLNVGIDVAKEALELALPPGNENWSALW